MKDNPHNFKEGDTVLYMGDRVKIVSFFNDITIQVEQTSIGGGTEVYYKNRWNKFWNIKSYRYKEHKIVERFNTSIWSLKPIQ